MVFALLITLLAITECTIQQKRHRSIPSFRAKSSLSAKLRRLENSYVNKTVSMSKYLSEVDGIYRDHAPELQKSLKLFQQDFAPFIRELKKAKAKKCVLRYETQRIGRGASSKRVRVSKPCEK